MVFVATDPTPMAVVREPAAAGSFYPADAGALATNVAELLNDAPHQEMPAPKVLIVPHAGYMYSGGVAAAGYATLDPHRRAYEKVILLGPAHRAWFKGLAVSSADAFRTPLGDVPVERAGLRTLGVDVMDTPHVREHSIEVHLPFLQSVLGDFVLVPIVVGDASPEQVGAVLDALWGGPEALIVVSSDLSHYLPYDKAGVIDARTCRAIEDLDGQRINHSMACGATPVAGLLMTAKERGLCATTLDLRNSGDVASGDRGSVVGYGAWMLA